MNLTLQEEELLYGRNNESNNFLSQHSPIVCEIINVSSENIDLLWLGLNKFNG